MAGAVHIDPVRLAAFVRSPEGPVVRHMLIVGERVQARALVELKEGFPRDFLGPSIVKRVEMVASGPRAGPHVFVGSERTRTQPHPIVGRPLLVFYWPRMGRTVFLRQVNHPGSEFGPYLIKTLLKALEAARGTI